MKLNYSEIMNFSVIPVELWHFKSPLKLKLFGNLIITQITQIMRIGIVLLIILATTIGFLSATPAKSQRIDQIEIRLELKNESLVKAFQKIESQSPFHFMYRNEDVKDIYNLYTPASKQTVEAFLKAILANTSLVYRQIDKQILITSSGRTRAISSIVRDIEDNKFLAIADGVIRGKVSDTIGVPMTEVSIQLEGAATHTKTTDANGSFSFTNLPAGNYMLNFSFVGFTKTTKAVTLAEGQESIINVVLTEEAKQLKDVVVVGYGTERRANVIGSVSQVSGEKLVNRPVTSLSNALAGQMSGVTVIQRSGKPGYSGGTINIRGIGSFGASSSPLVLVDGIPGSLDEININDIESISVLKDATSAAIYGARSANGVILVTTKKGIQGKARVNYTGYVGIQKPTEFPDLVNSWEYAELFNIASGTNTYTPEVIAKYKAMNDLDNYPNTNFLKETFSRNGVQTGHDISISGGQKSNQYYLSLGYLNQQGVIEKNDYKRYNFRMNTVNELSSKFTITTRMSGSIEQRNEPQPTANKNSQSVEEIVDDAFRLPAVYLGQASNGDFGLGQEGKGTAVSWLASASYRKRPVTKAGVNTKLDWKPVKGLILSAIGGYNYTQNEELSYSASQVLNPTTRFTTSILRQSRNQEIFQTLQSLAEYSKELNGNNFKLLAGYSFENGKVSSFSGSRQDFPSNDYTVLNIGGVGNQQVNGTNSEWAIQSIFGRLKYDYNSKYLFEATVRRDGSSRFPPTKKYATFPSLAAGWRVTEEEFFKAAFPWVSNLKLKASWGILGNQNIGDYPYQSTLSPGRDYPFGTGITSGAAYTNYKDQNIHWESTRSADVGIESEFFARKINFNLTYFNRNTDDILYTPSGSVSTILGANIGQTNTGELRNSGWEVELGHRNNFGDFNYQIQGIFSLINNEVVTLGLGNVTQPNGMVGNGSSLFIGYPLQLFYGYKTDGVFLSADDIKDWPNQTKLTPRAVPGDIRYVDISGPNGVPDGVVDPTYDKTYIGSSMPKYTFSFNLSMQFRGFDFTTFLQGVADVKGRLEKYPAHAFYNGGSVQRWQMEGRFDPQNPQRYPEHPRLELLQNGAEVNPNTKLSDWWAIDASYLRIKNLQLGYTLPQSILRSSHIAKMRFYLGAENLYTFKKYRKGWDPEMSTNANYYPILANYVFGINASL